MDIQPQALNHILSNLHILLIRDSLLDLFTITIKTKARLINDNQAELIDSGYIYTGKLLDINNELYSVVDSSGIRFTNKEIVSVIPLNMNTTNQICSYNTKIVLPPGRLINYKDSKELHTTTGRLLLNYTILVDPFGDKINYINSEWDIGKIESDYILEGLLSGKFTVDQIKHYSRNIHFIGHFTELSVPNVTERSLTIDPKTIAKRDELLEKYRSEIEAGDSTVMNKIETELIAMDKESLKGDVSTLFYNADKKSYEVHRKSMFILGGMVQKFGEKGYNFVERSLEEGWNVKDFPTIFNESRRGSYSRAKETAKGGEATKFVIRVFQEVRIVEDDCGSEDYLHITLTRDLIRKYIHRNILVDNKLVILSNDNISSFVNKTVLMRSPMHCHSQNGFCFTCMGELFRSINQELLTMIGIGVSSTFTNAALKSRHATVARTIEIKSLNKFVV